MLYINMYFWINWIWIHSKSVYFFIEPIHLSFVFLQAEHLAEFYEYCKGLDLARTFQFPTLRQVPFFLRLHV